MNREKVGQYVLSGVAILLFGIMTILVGTKIFTVPFPCGLGNPFESERNLSSRVRHHARSITEVRSPSSTAG